MGFALRLLHSGRCAGLAYHWYNAKLYGGFAELWFFLMKRNDGDEPPLAPLPEWPSLCPDYRENLGFDHGMFEPGRLPDLTASKGSGEWT